MLFPKDWPKQMLFLSVSCDWMQQAGPGPRGCPRLGSSSCAVPLWQARPLSAPPWFAQVTIWDLAGQAQYRALQDYLFPTFNQACVFLFAFSPFDAQEPDKFLSSDEMLQDKLRKSLKFWLRFINSNCRNVGSTLPRMFVVVTHVDQMPDAEILPDLLQTVLTELASDFKQVVHVTTTPLFRLDAGSAEVVKSLLDELLEAFRDVCYRLCAVLTEWVSQHPAQPIVKKQQFQTLFETQLRSFQKVGVQGGLTGVFIRNSEGSYTNDLCCSITPGFAGRL